MKEVPPLPLIILYDTQEQAVEIYKFLANNFDLRSHAGPEKLKPGFWNSRGGYLRYSGKMGEDTLFGYGIRYDTAMSFNPKTIWEWNDFVKNKGGLRTHKRLLL